MKNYIYLKTLKKILNIIIITIITIIHVNCSTLKNISNYNYNIDQGNYLNTQDIQKIHIGMTKNEISQNIGSPTLQDIFEPNIWYYIHYQQNRNDIKKQQIFILQFNKYDILINLKNESI